MRSPLRVLEMEPQVGGEGVVDVVVEGGDIALDDEVEVGVEGLLVGAADAPGDGQAVCCSP